MIADLASHSLKASLRPLLASRSSEQFPSPSTSKPNISTTTGSTAILADHHSYTPTPRERAPTWAQPLALPRQAPRLGLLSHSFHVWPEVSVGVAALHHETDRNLFRPGPFELTKLSAQIAVLMERRDSNNSMQTPIAEPHRSPAPKCIQGTWGTAKTIVRDRGLKGLYSGFHLHLCEFQAEKT